ncbi:MAG: exodeoxyribonuclease VII small subunit [Myxococcota bacterium]|jgi:exodeoxyribonuclease VII small subunit
MSEAQDTATPNADTDPTFEQLLGELEQVVDSLERGDVPLETALSAFERGTTLARKASGILDKAEARVAQILESRDGTIREAPLDFADQDSGGQRG